MLTRCIQLVYTQQTLWRTCLLLLCVCCCFVQGQHYQDMLRMDDLSLDVVPLQLTKTAFTGGYASVSACY